eukprot:4308959-Pyramimonas_sp.AAC.1
MCHCCTSTHVLCWPRASAADPGRSDIDDDGDDDARDFVDDQDHSDVYLMVMAMVSMKMVMTTTKINIGMLPCAHNGADDSNGGLDVDDANPQGMQGGKLGEDVVCVGDVVDDDVDADYDVDD